MSVTRRQFIALVGAGAAATLLPLPQLAHAEPAPAPTAAIEGSKGKVFRIVGVRLDIFADGPPMMHVEGIEVDGYMRIAFDMNAEKPHGLRPNDIVYVDVATMAWPLRIESDRGKVGGLTELTLTIPCLAEREAMDAWRDEQ